MRITVEEYTAAIEKLIPIAQQNTSGSRAAAQVLLSAYNGSEWQLDVTDLCVLDPFLYECALAVIRGRVELMIEPHTLVENGDKVFNQIWDRWRRYHIKNRWKDDCFTCNGRGGVYDFDDQDREIKLRCKRCGGTGLVSEQEP